MTQRLHTNYPPATRDRLDELFDAWQQAYATAEHVGFADNRRNSAADSAAADYDAAIAEAKATEQAKQTTTSKRLVAIGNRDGVTGYDTSHFTPAKRGNNSYSRRIMNIGEREPYMNGNPRNGY